MEMFLHSISKIGDFNTKQLTEFAPKNQEQLAPGLLGCQRESIGMTKVEEVLGKLNFDRAECVRCPWLLAQTKVATIFIPFSSDYNHTEPEYNHTEPVPYLKTP